MENKIVKISFYADEELRTRLKLACTAQNLSMNEVLTGLVQTWVEENDPFKKVRDKPDDKDQSS